MSDRINIGVVGCGYWGPNLIRNFKHLPGCTMKIMCDKKESRILHLKGIYPDIEGMLDYDEMLARSDVDAVVVATAVKHHYPMAKASLLAGKHTFIEKPMASSSEQCLELIEIAEKKGLVLMVGHTFLYSAPVQKIKEIISSKDFGEIQYISSRRLNLGLVQKDINVAWDLAPHDISIILNIMGEYPVSVSCQGNAHITTGVEDVTNMSLIFRNRRMAMIQSSWLDPRKVREMTIVGSRRMIVYDDVEPIEKIKIYDARVETPPHYDTFAEFQYSYHYGDRYVPYIEHVEPLKAECQHFLDCINESKTPKTSGWHGFGLVKILEGASQSLRQDGSAVYLINKPQDEFQVDPIVVQQFLNRKKITEPELPFGVQRSSRDVQTRSNLRT